MHLFEQTVFDELDLVAGPQDEVGVLPAVQLLEGFLRQVPEDVVEERQVILQRFVVDWHLGEFVEDKPNIEVELPEDVVGEESGLHLFGEDALVLDFDVDLVQDLLFGEAEAGVNFTEDLLLVLIDEYLLEGH